MLCKMGANAMITNYTDVAIRIADQAEQEDLNIKNLSTEKTVKRFFLKSSDEVCKIQNKSFGIFPSKTGISDRLPIYLMIGYFLTAFNQIAFNHYTLYKVSYFAPIVATGHNLTYDTNLFFELFPGIGMIGIDDTSWIYQLHFLIHIIESDKIFVMIILNRVAMFGNSTTKNSMGKRIAGGLNFVS